MSGITWPLLSQMVGLRPLVQGCKATGLVLGRAESRSGMVPFTAQGFPNSRFCPQDG